MRCCGNAKVLYELTRLIRVLSSYVVLGLLRWKNIASTSRGMQLLLVGTFQKRCSLDMCFPTVHVNLFSGSSKLWYSDNGTTCH